MSKMFVLVSNKFIFQIIFAFSIFEVIIKAISTICNKFVNIFYKIGMGVVAMKNYIINSTLNLLQNKYKYDDIKKNEIKYGLEGLYLVTTKIIIITLLAYLLGILTNYLLFLLFYIPIRSFSYGWHANKSYQCWIFSTISLLILPFIAGYITFNFLSKIIIIFVVLILFVIFAPADTMKKPIINPKKRLILKVLSVITVIMYALIVLMSSVQPIISNIIILSLIYQAAMITPVIYVLSNQPFNNYKLYNSY